MLASLKPTHVHCAMLVIMFQMSVQLRVATRFVARRLYVYHKPDPRSENPIQCQQHLSCFAEGILQLGTGPNCDAQHHPVPASRQCTSASRLWVPGLNLLSLLPLSSRSPLSPFVQPHHWSAALLSFPVKKSDVRIGKLELAALR